MFSTSGLSIRTTFVHIVFAAIDQTSHFSGFTLILAGGRSMSPNPLIYVHEGFVLKFLLN